MTAFHQMCLIATGHITTSFCPIKTESISRECDMDGNIKKENLAQLERQTQRQPSDSQDILFVDLYRSHLP